MKKKLFIITFSLISALSINFKSQAAEENTIIGCGVDLVSSTGTPLYGSSIFNLDEIEYVKTTVNTEKDYEYNSIGVEQFKSNFESSFSQDVLVDMPAYNLSLMNSLGINKSLTKSQYKYVFISEKSQTNVFYNLSIKDSAYRSSLINKLSPKFLDEVEWLNNNCSNDSISNFIKRFGSNIITSTNYGVSYNSVYTYYQNINSVSNQVEYFNTLDAAVKLPDVIDKTAIKNNAYVYNNSYFENMNTIEKKITSKNGICQDFENVYSWYSNAIRLNEVAPVSYPTNSLVPIYEFFPNNYDNLKSKVRDFINNNSKTTFEINGDDGMAKAITYEFNQNKDNNFGAGGGWNCKTWTITLPNYNEIKKLYSKMDISCEIWMEKRKNGRSYTSVYLAPNCDSNWINTYTFDLDKGWHTYTIEENDICIDGDKITLKFDANGLYTYGVGTMNFKITYKN